MSNAYYDELWLITKNDLDKLLILDKKLQEKAAIKGPQLILNSILPIYLRYRCLVKNLMVCYSQIVDAEKQNLIQRLLNCAVGRLLECKQEVVKVEFYDFQWPDDIMNRMKVTPDDIDIPAPIHKRQNKTSNSDYVKQYTKDENESISSKHFPSLLSAEEPRKRSKDMISNAILTIQSHEKARAGRSFANYMKKQFLNNKTLKSNEVVDKKIERVQLLNAVIIVQRAWRKYAASLALSRKTYRIDGALEMTVPTLQSRAIFEDDNKTVVRRLAMIKDSAEQAERVMSAKRTKMRSPGLMEDITDEIREWFILWYNSVGRFDSYPAKNIGGSIAIVTGQTLTPQEFLAQALMKQKPNQTKDKTKFNQLKKTETRKKRKGKNEWKMPETKNYNCLCLTTEDIQNWAVVHETSNLSRKKCFDPIAERLCLELQMQIRKIVDEIMRLELKRLCKMLQNDNPNNASLVTTVKEKKRGKKSHRKIKNRKIRYKTGMTEANISSEELFDTLVDENIIKKYPPTSLSDWHGDMSYQNYEARNEFRDYRYRIGEIKQILREYCVLPLLSREIHKVAPLTKSVCICGLPKSGKSFLVNAICAEVGALLLDVTPAILSGKFMGKVNQRRLMDMINNVSRAYAPSIVFIDGSEKPWIKKVPPEERHTQPRRFASYYSKFVKGIKQGDQILFLTTSAEPYKARKPFIKIHDKFVIIPSTDYNTLYMFYQHALMLFHGVPRDLDLSCLAKISVGIPLNFIKQAIKKVLSLKRRITFKFKPLQQWEILEEIMEYQAPSQKVLNKFLKFEYSTPLGRNRLKYLAHRKAQHKNVGQSKVKKKL